MTDTQNVLSRREPKEYNLFRRIFQWLTCTCVYAFYYKITSGLKIYGRQNVPKDKFFIMAANHMSAIDPFLLADAVGRPVAYMAKKELFEGFFGRFFLNLLGAFSVNREKLSVSTIKTAIGIKKTNWVLGLFPQGTREQDGNMDNISRGFAGLAKTLKCDILPVAITGALKEERRPFESKITIRIGKPIPYSDDTAKMTQIWTEKIVELTQKSEKELKHEDNLYKNRKRLETHCYSRKYAKDFNILTRLYQVWAMILFWPFVILFYKVKVNKNKNFKKRPIIIAPNHISYFDPFLATIAYGFGLAYMAKKELFEDSSYIAKNITRLGAFSVNREKLEVSTIKSAKEVFKAKFSLCIFPQGGIRKNKRIEIINKGFVVLAKMVKVDILPIGLAGVEKYNWNPFKKAVITLNVGEPISYTEDDEVIIEKWRHQVANLTGYELG